MPRLAGLLFLTGGALVAAARPAARAQAAVKGAPLTSADQKPTARDSLLVPGANAAQTTAVLKETNAAAQQAVEQMAAPRTS